MKKQTLIIICGIPGSGKSTLAESFYKNGIIDAYYEADMWMMEDGEYKFAPEKLGYAHKSCQDAVRKALQDRKSVAVANTNIRPSDRKIYIKMGKEYDVNIQLIQVNGNFGSIHNVPLDKIQEMSDTLHRNWNPRQELQS